MTTPETPEPLTFCPDCGSSSPAQHFTHCPHYEKSGLEPYLERSMSVPGAIGYVPIRPSFVQRQLPELMREQARWVKSMPPTAASLLERAAIELDEANTMRRLHEQATENAAAYRTALERIIDGEDDRRTGKSATPLFDAIDEARKLLEGRVPPPTEAPAARRRLASCVEQWPEAETGAYNPACCRFPKSCSATVYSDDIDEAYLETRGEVSE